MPRFLSAIGVMLVSTAVAVGAFEVFLRATGYSAPMWYEPHDALGWSLRPGASGTFTTEGRAEVRVNSAGFRDREHPLEKPPATYRIAVLGDSYSEAMQVPLEEAYWAQLPARLAGCGFQPGREVAVLNFGVAGFGTAQQLVMLETVAQRYRPDLVLLQFTNGNDVRNNSFALEEEKQRPFFTVDARGRLRADSSFVATEAHLRRSSLPWEIFRGASDYSRVVQLLRAVRQAPLMSRASAADAPEAGLETAVLVEPKNALWQEAWRTTEALIARTRDGAARQGAAFLLVTVPYAVQVHPDRRVREAMRRSG